jgi:protein HIRA/HIR1
MVVAEVPLWVVHSTATTNGMLSSSATPKTESTEHHMERAQDSLSLLEGLGGTTQKVAIYSIDIHPNGTKFATGGGDGTVRLWNSSALFRQHPQKAAEYKAGGTYESSGESSVDDQHADEKETTQAAPPITQVSSSSSSSNDDGSGASEMEQVHDLTSLVRKKHGGNVLSTPTVKSPSLKKKVSSSTTPHAPKHTHHRLLCTLSAHTGSSVLAVRFSTNGQYLASAGDDSVVCIYAPAATTSSSSATNNNNTTNNNNHNNLEHPSVEHWTRIKLCRGHALDVVGLAWAPDDSHLVSCSLDSNTPIIVWKLTDLTRDQRPTHSNVLCNPYKILGKGIHTSTVKGVTFDPAGTYLASSGDDPSICIWRAHDDWGLEKRVDSNAGIFRRWKEGDAQALSSQTLFRRLSWSTDGAYICSTNSVVKNKHVASTISREGWAVSSSQSAAAGAANLVGHKHPVVVSRHCPFLLDARKPDSEENDDEPEYATLLALGDKRGFVTVWSTKRSRPVFKLQCSETRCTVTDLAWGRVEKDLMLLVSLLDGQVVALRFGVPTELGNVLKKDDQARVFQLRYGIDLNDVSDMGKMRLFVGENSGPKLIENALQLTLEDRDEDEEDEMDPDESFDKQESNRNFTSTEVKANQTETSKSGKKRIRPVLMSVDDHELKRTKTMTNGESDKKKAAKKKLDPLQDAMETANKAASGAEAVATQNTTAKQRQESAEEQSGADQEDHGQNTPQNTQRQLAAPTAVQPATPQVPHSTDRIHSIELPVDNTTSTSTALENGEGAKFVADCTNSIQIPKGSSGSALPCTVLSISCGGQAMWKDQLLGASCSSIAASKQLLAVGTSDGSVQLYGTSPTMGWASGAAFRSHAPFVFGSPIVAVQLHDKTTDDGKPAKTEMLVIAADGMFGVYSVVPELKIRYKGTIMPPMQHMLLSSDMSNEINLPKLARIQITDSNRLLLLLSLHSPQGTAEDNRTRGNNSPSVGAGGSLQAFVYNDLAELWMRVADSRFVLSDFYSTIPSAPKSKKASGELSQYDDTVRMGAMASTLKPSRRGRSHIAGGHADAAYNQTGEDSGNDVASRAHCEDRMACAVALGSAQEFEHWISMYVKTLVMCGNESLLRVVVDMLLSGSDGDAANTDGSKSSWWLSSAPQVLSLDRAKLVRSIVIPEMSKNRALQRITNEIAMEIESLN